jgi:hypothetical protein
MSGWSSSSEEDGAVADEGEGPQLLAPPVQQPLRRRGRPKKQAACEEPPPQLVAEVCPWDGLARVGIGDEAIQGVARALNEPREKRQQLSGKLGDLVERCLGREARWTLSKKAQAIALGYSSGSSSWVSSKVDELAAGVFTASRLAAGSVCSWIARQIDSGSIVPVAAITSLAQDETPMQAGHRATDGRFATRERVTTKIVQSELIVAFVLVDAAKGQPFMVFSELPTHLQRVSNTTADTLETCVKEQMQVPLLTALRSKFPCNVDISSGDRGSANLKMDVALENVWTHARLCRLGCQTHCLHTVQGRVFNTLPSTISGVIAVALAQEGLGSAGKLRDAIKQVLMDSADIHINILPPRKEDSNSAYRAAVFDLLLPKTIVGRKRRAVLERLLHGDMTGNSIDVYFRLEDASVVKQREALEEWAQDVADALFPCAHKVFPRHRWLTSVETLEGPALLCACHNLLPRAVPLWMAALARAAKDKGNAGQAGADSNLDDESLVPVGGNDQDKKSAWVKENEKARGDARAFALSEPLGPLLLLRISMGPQIALMRHFLYSGSAAWDADQQKGHVLGKASLYRIVEAHRGESTKTFYATVSCMMDDPSFWDALPPQIRTVETNASAFALLAKAVG